MESSQDPSATRYLHAASWPVEVSLEDAVQDLSNHRSLLSQELEINGVNKEPLKIPQPEPELEEVVKTVVSCEQQAEELHGHLSVWEDSFHR